MPTTMAGMRCYIFQRCHKGKAFRPIGLSTAVQPFGMTGHSPPFVTGANYSTWAQEFPHIYNVTYASDYASIKVHNGDHCIKRHGILMIDAVWHV